MISNVIYDRNVRTRVEVPKVQKQKKVILSVYDFPLMWPVS